MQIERVRGTGLVAINEPDGEPDRGGAVEKQPMSNRNLVIRKSEFTRVASPTVLKEVRFVSCRRAASPASVVRAPQGAVWGSDRSRPELSMPLLPGVTLCRGNSIRMRLSAACHFTGQTSHVEIRTMGASVISIDLAPSEREILFDLRLTFLGASFAEPDHYHVTGAVLIDGTPLDNWKQFAGSFDPSLPNQVDMYAWGDGPPGQAPPIIVQDAAIEFRAVENGPYN